MASVITLVSYGWSAPVLPPGLATLKYGDAGSCQSYFRIRQPFYMERLTDEFPDLIGDFCPVRRV